MSLAKEFRVSIAKRGLTFNQDVKALIPCEELDPIFLFYYLLSQNSSIRDSASEAAHGTKKLVMAVLEQWPIPLPLKTTQRKIAAILSAYDDLIENNKRRIALLEQMAEEIYREWFVRMRFPGHENTKFEKGIPKGWDNKKLREIVSYYIGGGWGEELQNSSFSDGAYVIRGTDIPKINAGELSKNIYRYHKPSNLKSRELQVGDFVFEVSGGSKNQLLGRNTLVTESLLTYFENKVMCASFCKQIRFDQEQVSPYFMKYFLKLYYETELVSIYQVQSTGISNYQFKSFLTNQPILLPPHSIRNQFDEIIKPLTEQKDRLALANTKSVKVRDLLLGRLISGKLSVEGLDIQFPLSMQEDVEILEQERACG